MSSVAVAAIDLGASSGRVVLAEVGPRTLHLEPVARFANDPVRTPDGLHWNVLELYRQVLGGLRTATRRSEGRLTSAAVDSWAVDYALIRDGQMVGVPFHYRDERRAAGVDVVHRVADHRELYQRNGLQFLPFNTLYQLAADPLVGKADQLLLVPDLMSYWLTGEMVTERTNASTTGLLDVRTGAWDVDLVDRLGLPRRVLGPLVSPGDEIGSLQPFAADQVGSVLAVTAVGSHDTASAVVGVPIQREDAAFISCGTWGLVGVELEKPVLTEASRAANFTNEAGVDGRIRYLSNVMGLWLLSESMRTWQLDGHQESLEHMLGAAADAPWSGAVFDVQDPVFLPPGDMPARIRQWYAEAGHAAPASRPELVSAIVGSLAQAFAAAVDRAEGLSGHPVGVIHLVGGGALNSLLCQATADRSGRVVLAGPVEATAIGNVLVQARTAGALAGELEDLRRLVADSTEPARYRPRPGSSRMAP